MPRAICRRLLLAVLLAGEAQVHAADEAAHNDAFCAAMDGIREVRHGYTYPTGQGYVLVDCETEDTVYEGGLDRRSSLDSVQQALFFSFITGKEPAVVIYDTDDRIGSYEHRIQVACEMAGVWFINWPLDQRAMKHAIQDVLAEIGAFQQESNTP